jgi:predicted MFS family arabinose efflux permease
MDGNSSNDSDTPVPSPIASASLLLATVLPVLAFVGLTPILPQIEAHFHAQAGASFIVRILVSVIGPTVIVGAPFAGLLATRFGERRVVIWATVAFGLAGCVAYVLDDLYAILASRIIVGLAIAATSTRPAAVQFVLEPVARYANAAAAILCWGFFAALLAMWSIGRVRMERRALAG